MKQIILKDGKDRSLRGRHPWVFSGAIATIRGEPRDGDVVRVVGAKGDMLGVGHYFAGSIAVRMVAFEDVHLDREFWRKRITDAYTLRKTPSLIDSEHTDAYRLINAEGDGLPGLIIDIYRRSAVIQFHSTGMFQHQDEIVAVLKELLAERLGAIYVAKTWEREAGGERVYGDALDGEILENGLRFALDIEHGQKTGFFLDQRNNRKLIGELSRGKRVLNSFCYSGGFSVYAAQGGAVHVDSVDASASAIELCKRNMQLNAVNIPHEEIVDDCMDYFRSERCRDAKYDLIVVDPPAFAKHRSAVPDAERGYRRLNEMALRAVVPGGLVATFSCSQVVGSDLFQKLLFQAATSLRRHVRIIHRLSHPLDHPVSLFHPEGEYLKGFVLQVG